ncbi:hypothetical protein [Hydrogenoanaerobacterium sp.]|uniref:hypothetical protein n=1 Tax=Hydrogenoanaerobacterium sp. TaxID=2953763 RepID=UPI0028995066|nr:hypothetical protein [Hydrogenoanaerobacterium sp.]
MSNNLSALKSRLTIYKVGLRRAVLAQDHDAIEKWKAGIDALQKEIDDIFSARWHC